ncbi:MAG: WxL domain-containing protein [Thermoleophilaceae bacterium]
MLFPAAAPAAIDTTSVTLTGGTLDFSVAPTADDFTSTALTGSTQTLTTSFNDWRVNDARGSGAGWHVAMQASQFSNGASLTLPAGSLTLKAPTVSKVDVLNPALPPVVSASPAPPWTLDGGSAITVVSAATATGQGEWNFDHANLSGSKDLALTIPANASAGTYTSTVTSTLSTGP